MKNLIIYDLTHFKSISASDSVEMLCEFAQVRETICPN